MRNDHRSPPPTIGSSRTLPPHYCSCVPCGRPRSLADDIIGIGGTFGGGPNTGEAAQAAAAKHLKQYNSKVVILIYRNTNVVIDGQLQVRCHALSPRGVPVWCAGVVCRRAVPVRYVGALCWCVLVRCVGACWCAVLVCVGVLCWCVLVRCVNAL